MNLPDCPPLAPEWTTLFERAPRADRGETPEPSALFVRPPEYPEHIPLAERTDETVILCIAVGRDGEVAWVEALSGRPEFRKSAQDAVEHWRYETLLDSDAEPTRWISTVVLRFKAPPLPTRPPLRKAGPLDPFGERSDGSFEPGPIDIQSIGISPIAIFQPQPPYPSNARAKNLTGNVEMEIVVDETGAVTSAKVIVSQPPFDDPALKTIKKWRYQPVVVNGVSITWKTKVNLNFRLR